MTDILAMLRKQYYSGHHDKAFDKAADEIERLRDAEFAAKAELNFAFIEIARLKHIKANLHGHVKRLEQINSRLERDNAKLREALEKIALYGRSSDIDTAAMARAALQKDEGK